MDSLKKTSGYCYHSDDLEDSNEFSGTLEIFAHHARNIHNICIYDNQDVYAKFSLTYNPDEMVSTRVIVGGGKNPDFEEKLELKVNQNDAVLKCEIWVLSRARNLMEDQLLGFALVPIPLIISQGGKITAQNFSLSSTDLFHSPAGTVQLSLSITPTHNSSVSPLNSSVNNPFPNFSASSSISSEVVLLDPNDYLRVEFPDINAATEDQMIVSEYFGSSSNPNSCSFGSFLHLGSALKAEYDYEMTGNSSEENQNSPIGSNRNSGVLSSTTTSLSDDRNTADSNSIYKGNNPSTTSTAAVASQAEVGVKHRKHQKEGSNLIEHCRGIGSGYNNVGRVRNMDLEAEQAAMQQQIVDMYMKSMQQFTESLAKMKLPMDLDPDSKDEGPINVIQVMDRGSKSDVENKKKDGSRVFYGSRAFF